MLSQKQQISKRLFDISLGIIGLIIFLLPMIFFIIIASFSTKSFGIFSQNRVGKNAKLFKLFKIKSMRVNDATNHITSANDLRVTKFGKFLRKSKMDELPQLFNVLIGDMSFVGPRPDVEGYADKLIGDDRIILSVKPGITGPATIKFNNEEELLAQQENPIKYNDEVIWPQKVKINLLYIEEWSMMNDIRNIYITVLRLSQ
ncbi:MAG: sugar transferase [Urechidicola sp.]|nr:sugar transferase [Urechidicola sp.]